MPREKSQKLHEQPNPPERRSERLSARRSDPVATPPPAAPRGSLGASSGRLTSPASPEAAALHTSTADHQSAENPPGTRVFHRLRSLLPRRRARRPRRTPPCRPSWPPWDRRPSRRPLTLPCGRRSQPLGWSPSRQPMTRPYLAPSATFFRFRRGTLRVMVTWPWRSSWRPTRMPPLTSTSVSSRPRRRRMRAGLSWLPRKPRSKWTRTPGPRMVRVSPASRETPPPSIL